MTDFQDMDFGTPFVGTGGAIRVNQRSIANEFSKTAQYRYIRFNKQFEIYDCNTGTWSVISADEIKNMIFTFALSLHDELDIDDVCVALTDNVLSAIARQLQCIVGVDQFQVPKQRCIHLKSGMLIFDDSTGDFTETAFAPEYNSRYQLELKYNPQAKCERFINELILPMLHDKMAIEMIQLYFGQCLLRENISQTFMILSGPASVGKSVLVNIIEKILGEENVDELHPDRLNNPFEMVAYSGKSLLTAKDVENDVLSANKINAIKKMTGNDLLSCEQKHSNFRIQARGCFNIIITGHGDLTLNYGSSRDAFKRRMLWIDCVVPENFRRINNFDDVLMSEEGEGILAWAIEGAKKLLANGGKIIKSKEQNDAIEYLLDESNPIDSFVKQCVSVETDYSVTSAQIVEMFYKFANRCRWNNDTLLRMTQRQIEQKFHQAILRWRSEIRPSTNIRQPETGKLCRGYLHCRITLPSRKS